MTAVAYPVPLAPATADAEMWTVVRQQFLRYWECASGDWAGTRFFGLPVLKLPTDLWVYQEIITATRPDVLVETGTCAGGSALYFATLMDLLGHGEVVTVDISDWPNPDYAPETRDALGVPGRPLHPRITYLRGSSVDEDILATIRARCDGKRVMVVLDSSHTDEHVTAELAVYPQLVTPGMFLVVEDTGFTPDTHPFQQPLAIGAGPALQRWLPQHPEFVPETACERFIITTSPGGWLRRLRTNGEGSQET